MTETYVLQHPVPDVFVITDPDSGSLVVQDEVTETLVVEAPLVLVGPKGEKGDSAGSDFKVWSHNPVTVTDAIVAAAFVADQASTVLSAGSIGSTGTASPTFSTPPLNYESATASNLAGGSFALNITTDYTYQLLMFHKPGISAHDLMTLFVNGGVFPSSLGFVVGVIGFGSPTPVLMIPPAGGSSTVMPTLADPSIATVTLADGHIVVGDASMDLDVTVYSCMTYFVTQSLLGGSPATVATFNFTNELLAHEVLATPIPDDANDGDALVIVGKGVVLGKSVNVFDVAWLYGDKTQVLVIPRYPAGLSAVSFSGSYLDLSNGMTAGYGIGIGSNNAIAIDQSIVATRTLLAQEIADLSDTMVTNYNQAIFQANFYTDNSINGLLNGVITSLTSRVNSVEQLFDSYQTAFAQKANQADLDDTNQALFGVTQAIAYKANQTDLDALNALVATKASINDMTAAIAQVIGAAPAALDTLYEISQKFATEDDAIAAVMSEVGTRVSFAVLQSLTTLQQSIARANIAAEAQGTAAGLIALITPSSISAATAVQGGKAETALQPSDIADIRFLLYAYSNVGSNGTVTNVALVPNTGETSTSISLGSKGPSGFISAQAPAGTILNGNLRGANAVDWQQLRTAATQVANGSYAVISGGRNNTASATNSVVIGGNGNTASGTNSTVLGGNVNTASGTTSTAMGAGANASQYGQFAQSSIQFAAQGDNQTSVYILGVAATASSTDYALTGDHGVASTANQIVVALNSLVSFEGTVIAHRKTADGTANMAWSVGGLAIRGASGNCSILGTPTITALYGLTAPTGWALTISADTTNNRVKISFNMGSTPMNVNVMATIRSNNLTN